MAFDAHAQLGFLARDEVVGVRVGERVQCKAGEQLIPPLRFQVHQQSTCHTALLVLEVLVKRLVVFGNLSVLLLHKLSDEDWEFAREEVLVQLVRELH